MPTHIDERLGEFNFEQYFGFNNQYSIDEMNNISLRKYIGNLINYLKFDYKSLKNRSKEYLINMIMLTDISYQSFLSLISNGHNQRKIDAIVEELTDFALQNHKKGFQHVVSYVHTKLDGIKETSWRLSVDLNIERDSVHLFPNQAFSYHVKDLIPVNYFDMSVRDETIESALFGLGKLSSC